MDYRSIIESKYNRTNWQKLLYDIFRQNIRFWQQPIEVSVDENMAKTALYIGQISLPDGHGIAVYEVELSDKVIIERNRAGIRNLLCTNWVVWDVQEHLCSVTDRMSRCCVFRMSAKLCPLPKRVV